MIGFLDIKVKALTFQHDFYDDRDHYPFPASHYAT